ncbi:MAG: NAD(P)H-dependent oxidoreductase [Pseudomonadota bacterium]
MHIFSLIAHPRADSFCHAISDTARHTLAAAGHQITHHDLYAEGFDPSLTASEAYTIGDSVEDTLARCDDPLVRTHRQEIAAADGILIVHPNWWGKPPAILAGWMDRVLVPGVAYRLPTADGRPNPLLQVRHALVFNTSDTEAERERQELGDPLQAIWTRCVLPYCGAEDVHRHVFRPVVGSTNAARASWLREVGDICGSVFGT